MICLHPWIGTTGAERRRPERESESRREGIFLECRRAFLFSHWSHSFGCMLRRAIVKCFHRQICPSGIQIGHPFFFRHFSPDRFSVATAARPVIFDLFSPLLLKKIGFSVASIVFTCFASLATLVCRCLTTVKKQNQALHEGFNKQLYRSI